MKYSTFTRLLLAVLLVLVTGSTTAVEPCTPFERRGVDMRLIEGMREAARDGRMYLVMPGSMVGFCVKHFPGREFRGEFTDLVGGLALPPAVGESGKALLLIHTTSMVSSEPDLESIVLGHRFMNVEHYPEILFEGREFHWINPQTAHIHGDLTMHGIRQPMVFDVDLEILDFSEDRRPGYMILRGKGQVDRVAFDMRSHRFLVSETVRLCLSVELERWRP